MRQYYPLGFEGIVRCSEIVEDDISETRSKFSLSLLVEHRSQICLSVLLMDGQMKFPSTRLSWRQVFEGGILILIVEVSSYFVISPLQVDPLSRRTLIPIQVLGEFHGVSFGMHEVLFLYR